MKHEWAPDQIEDFDYDYIGNEAARRDIFTFVHEVSQYIHDLGGARMLFLDQSAREIYAGFDEYWEHVYPNEEKPDFFFTSPKMYQEQATLTIDVIAREFAKTYPQLMKDLEKPLIIIDTCAHSGDSIRSVKTVLEHIGFSNIKIVTANAPEQGSGITADITPLQECEEGCYPFGRPDEGRLVTTDPARITATVKPRPSPNRPTDRFNHDMNRNIAERRRLEIRQVIVEELSQQ